MGVIAHLAGRMACRSVLAQCVRTRIIHRERLAKPGPLIVACSHISHLEPFLLSCAVQRRIDWMARVEFFRNPLAATLLKKADAFSVNRQGVPISAIRTAIRRLNAARVVGIFPEGGVTSGPGACFRGGQIKGGACLVSIRTGVPIVPVVVVGTEALNRVEPWLPLGFGRVWINVGAPIAPPANFDSRREARIRMTCALRRGFVETYRELLDTFDLDDARIP